MDAFAEHWGFVVFSLEKWIHEFISNPEYDPSMWLIAWAEMHGWLPQARSYSPFERLIIYSFFFILVVPE